MHFISSLISYYFLLFIGAIISNVTLNTKHVEVLVFRHLSGAFVISVTALVIFDLHFPFSFGTPRCTTGLNIFIQFICSLIKTHEIDLHLCELDRFLLNVMFSL